MEQGMYRSYFDFDENYFPQVTDSAIRESEDLWLRTFPHATFIELLRKMERVMARQERRSLWISGAYGTGKSQCAYTLKKILDVPEAELRAYWESYDALKKEGDLYQRLLGHRNADGGIVTVYRYANTPNSTRELLFAVQESVQRALQERGMKLGTGTLREDVAAWLTTPYNRDYMDALLKQEKWAALFGGMTADDVLVRLSAGDDVRELMEHIMQLSDDAGIRMIRLDVDMLKAWLTDVIAQNKIKLVFLWDEFSDYFRVNSASLADFQSLAELVNETPFFFIPVTHETGHLFTQGDETWKKVSDRFLSVGITLPDNIAFDLIGAAFRPKKAAKAEWAEYENDLNSRLHDSRQRVMATAKIASEEVIKRIMPLHPMTALVLKHIAAAFQSNQRSMFDFIKSTGDDQVKAFQYFIDHTGPLSENPLLTVDQLWDFFYVRGRANLVTHIRMMLDTYEQQTELRTDERRVLKAILILLAVDEQLGSSIELLEVTDQNLSYVFEGDALEQGAVAIAQKLKQDGILIEVPRSKGAPKYALAKLSGDEGKIEQYKEELRKTHTDKLVETGQLGTLLTLRPEGLKPRYLDAQKALTSVTVDNVTRTINGMSVPEEKWRIPAVIAFAKDEKEAAELRAKLKAAAQNPRYAHIVFIDALATPLGAEAFAQYVDRAAMARYYQGNNRQEAEKWTREANQVLTQEWKNRIYAGRFYVYTAETPDGMSCPNNDGVSDVLKQVVLRRYPEAFDLDANATEGYYKDKALKPSALAGLTGRVTGTITDAEKRVLSAVWDVPDYAERAGTKDLPIARMRQALDAYIREMFHAKGQVETSALCDLLLNGYGLPPCNLTAFLLGFLLRDYAREPYRYADAAGRTEAMTPEKLAEMIGNELSPLTRGGKRTAETFLVEMTEEERAFYTLTQKAWGIPAAECTSVAQVQMAIRRRAQECQLPLWCLAGVTEGAVYNAVAQYADLLTKEGGEAHAIARALGERARQEAELGDALAAVLAHERLEAGMTNVLAAFEDGALPRLAEELGCNAKQLLADVRRQFKEDYACLWSRETGVERLHGLLTEYRACHASATVLGETLQTWARARTAWRERLDFLRISAEWLAEESPVFARLRQALVTLAKGEDLLPELLRSFADQLAADGAEIARLLNDAEVLFGRAYAPYLEGLTEAEQRTVYSRVEQGLFLKTKTYASQQVRSCAEAYRRSRLKQQLAGLWEEKTGTADPRRWSERYETPVLACVPAEEYDAAQRAFSYLTHSDARDEELREAIAFFERAQFFAVLTDAAQVDDAFRRNVLGRYASLLTDLVAVRKKLAALGISAYDWQQGNPRVAECLKRMAQAVYAADGAERVRQKIDSMDDRMLKAYLQRLVADNMTVGMEILEHE